MKKISESKCFCVHVGYIIAILIGVIIALSAILAIGAPKLYENISFASTMSSLILSIIAILYALQTSGALVSSLDKIEKTSLDLKNTSQTLEKSNVELGEKVDILPNAIAKIKETVERTHEHLEKKMFTIDHGREKSDIHLSDDNIEKYITNSDTAPFDGWIIIRELYSRKLAIDIDRYYNYKDNSFIQGSFISKINSALSLNLVKIREINKNQRGYVAIEYINETALKVINNMLESSEYNLEEDVEEVIKNISVKIEDI